jgi:hypothetical protein
MTKSLIDTLNEFKERIEKLESAVPAKQVDYSADIEKVKKSIPAFVDYSKDIDSIKKDIAALHNLLTAKNNNSNIDIASEVEKIVTIDFVTNLYRNK